MVSKVTWSGRLCLLVKINSFPPRKVATAVDEDTPIIFSSITNFRSSSSDRSQKPRCGNGSLIAGGTGWVIQAFPKINIARRVRTHCALTAIFPVSIGNVIYSVQKGLGCDT